MPQSLCTHDHTRGRQHPAHAHTRTHTHAYLMAVVNSAQHHAKEAARLLLLDPLVGDNVIKELPTHRVLHDDVDEICRLDDIVDAHDVRVVEKLEKADFPLQPGDLLGRADLGLFDDLDRDLPCVCVCVRGCMLVGRDRAGWVEGV